MWECADATEASKRQDAKAFVKRDMKVVGNS